MFDNQSSDRANGGGKDDTIDSENLEATLQCRSVRIGSYKYFPPEGIAVKLQGLTLKVPMPGDPGNKTTIFINNKDIVKVLINFNKSLPVIFYSVKPSVGQFIRAQLGMVDGDHTYFDPLAEEDSYRMITIVLHIIPESIKIVIRSIYNKPNNIMDELTSSEANAILIKTCPKEVQRGLSNIEHPDIKQLFIYPPEKGGISVNTEDYLCLAKDQFLNDVIIDFYLKYLVSNLSEVMQQKVYVFSTFFYKCLTTKPPKIYRHPYHDELDLDLTPAQKRHARVEKWTKNVNLFEKDFIIIPINEDSHWFLAMICFPGMNGRATWNGYGSKLESKQKRKKSTVVTTLYKGTDDSETSDKDDESGLDSDVDSEDASRLRRLPIKQASILIFDSLEEVSMSGVFTILKDYLACEYKIKIGEDRLFNKDTIKCSCPKVPQQTNLSDCGLYLLQYVEEFFKKPIKDYHVPIKELNDWFDESVVTKKREDISNLIKKLMVKYNKNLSILPAIDFPTLSTKSGHRDKEFDEDDEDFIPEKKRAPAHNNKTNSGRW